MINLKELLNEESFRYKVIIICLVFLQTLFFFVLSGVQYEFKTLNNNLNWYYEVKERQKMIDDGFASNVDFTSNRFNLTSFNGYAVSDNFYCVWTKGQTEKEIASTDVHERCHVLTEKSYEHFCK